jgi:hypothetical protein
MVAVLVKEVAEAAVIGKNRYAGGMVERPYPLCPIKINL